jgi:lysophospholipase
MFPDGAHELLRETDSVRLDALAAIDLFLDRRAAR